MTKNEPFIVAVLTGGKCWRPAIAGTVKYCDVMSRREAKLWLTYDQMIGYNVFS